MLLAGAGAAAHWPAIDGSWRFAKGIYKWNPHVGVACTRITVSPPAPSIFGELKREPSVSAVSTAEAAALALGALLHGEEQCYLPVWRPAICDCRAGAAPKRNAHGCSSSPSPAYGSAAHQALMPALRRLVDLQKTFRDQHSVRRARRD